MSTTEETTTQEEVLATGPVSRPGVGDPDATYRDPDLSFKDSVGELPEDEKAWDEARDTAAEESLKAAEEGEKTAIEARQKLAEERAAEAEKNAELAKQIKQAQDLGAQPVVQITPPGS